MTNINVTVVGVDKASQAFKKVGQAAEDMGEGLDDAGTAAKETSRSSDLLKDAITTAGIITAGKAAFELAKLGAESHRTRDAFIAISGGASEAEMRLEAMQRATRGALSEQQAMASANQLMQMGLANNASELERVTQMAVRLGTAMGRNAGDAISEFSLLLANQSIPRLDTFGISAGKVRSRINELTSSVGGMTREQAFMQAVMEQGDKAMGRLGDAAEDDALQFERLEAQTADLKATFGELISGPMSEFVKVGNEGLATLQLLVTWNQQLEQAQMKHAEETAITAATYADYITELERSAGVTGMVVNAEGDLVEVLQVRGQTVEQVVQENFALTESEFELARAINEVQNTTDAATTGWANAAEVMRGQTEAAVAARDGMEGLHESGARVAKTFGELTFDNETLWNMAMASGASTDALALLAQNLGIATNAEIQHALAAQQMVAQFGEGAISAAELESGFRRLATAESVAAVQAANLEKETRGVISGVSGIASVDDDAAASALALAEAEATATQNAMERREQVAELSDGLIETSDVTTEMIDTAGRYEDQMGRVQRSESDVTTESGRMREEFDRGRVATDNLADSADYLQDRFRMVENAAIGAQNAISNIEREITVTVNYNWTGTPPGEGGGGSPAEFDLPPILADTSFAPPVLPIDTVGAPSANILRPSAMSVGGGGGISIGAIYLTQPPGAPTEEIGGIIGQGILDELRRAGERIPVL